MLPFLVTAWANPLVRKITLYVAVGLACLYALRLWGNAQWAKGEKRGRVTATEFVEKQKRAEWKEKETALIAAAKEIGAEKQAVVSAKIQVETDRANLSRTLKDALARLQAERGKQYENAAAIPATELDNALRSVSVELSTNP
jgi:hypothetical protein